LSIDVCVDVNAVLAK